MPEASDRAGLFGRRLGHLIATLTAADHYESDASKWRAAYLRHWHQVREVWLGGGLAAALGTRLADAATREARRLGSAGVRVSLAPNPNELALIGLARTPRPAANPAVVLDFGHSRVKGGIALYSARGHLGRLQLLPGASVPVGADMVHFVVDTVARRIQMAERQYGSVQRPVGVSIASYVRDGRPFDTRSIYAPLTPEAFGCQVELEHDGTAAARGVQPTAPAAAVIVLGTALGIGFAPATAALVPFADGFSVLG